VKGLLSKIFPHLTPCEHVWEDAPDVSEIVFPQRCIKCGRTRTNVNRFAKAVITAERINAGAMQ
jgi:hypothetical protein